MITQYLYLYNVVLTNNRNKILSIYMIFIYKLTFYNYMFQIFTRYVQCSSCSTTYRRRKVFVEGFNVRRVLQAFLREYKGHYCMWLRPGKYLYIL